MIAFGFAVALAAVALMGFAIQRGGTCAVAAVEELLLQRRATRLLALAEASAWVAGGMALLQVLGRLPAAPASHAATLHTVLGGVLLGLGAWVNKACVFGAIARFGNGEWAYAATPLGFYLGCLSLPALGAMPSSAAAGGPSPVLAFPRVAALAFVVFAAARLARSGWAVLRRTEGGSLAQAVARRVWAPHAATCVIGLTFLVVLVAAGSAWTYTDVLAELARGMGGPLAPRLALLGALALGAVAGGWTAGRLKPTMPRPARVLGCLAGGWLMGWGTLLTPGANDGLILVGLPLLRPYAWLALGTMVLTIATAIATSRALAPRLNTTRNA